MKTWHDWNIAPGGRGMISASAGTGKTFTIAVLYIRMILDEKFLPDQIVVTTFTNAAVAELGERLRGRIYEALSAASFDGDYPNPKNDPLLNWLKERWVDLALKEADRKQLLSAWSAMDRAPILTLHGFCSKLIGEYPLLLDSPLQPTPLMSEGAVAEEVANDIWRRHTQLRSDNNFPELFGKRKSLQDDVFTILRPELRLGDVSEDRLQRWLKSETGTRVLATVHDVLNNRMNALAAGRRLTNNLAGLGEFLESVKGGDHPPADIEPEDFSAAIWRKTIKKGFTELLDSLDLVAMDELVGELRAYALLPKLMIYQEARDRAAELLTSRNVTTFGQMIYRVFAVLNRGDATARELADSVFARYPVVMIDESQDTDQVQYAIMDEIYRDASCNPRGRMIMIGDDKQAIYGFRGGDVECFQRAKEAANDTLELHTNFRSSPEMLDGFNSFYDLVGHDMRSTQESTFGTSYEVFRKPDVDGQDAYLVNGEREAHPMQLHVESLSSFGEKVSAPLRREIALQTCANQIASMLQSGDHVIESKNGKRNLQPGDFAVIMRNNADVATMRRLLTLRGVPSVAQMKNSVLGSPWLLDVATVVSSAAEPAHEGKFAAAKLTRIFQQGAELDSRKWSATLKHAGILGLMLELLRKEGPHLMARPDGERVMTDIRHLAEIMQDHFAQSGDVAETLRWIYHERDNAAEDPDAPNNMRMESDAKRVQIMTAHASKGLEFNIVMLPTLYYWIKGNKPSGPQTIKGDDRVHLRLAESKEDDALLSAATGDENHRLQYVALTRAKLACHAYVIQGMSKCESALMERWSLPQTPLHMPGLVIHDGFPSDYTEVVHWRGSMDNSPELRTEALQPPVARMPRYQHSFSTMTRTHHEQATRGGEDESDVEVAEDTTTKNATILKLNKVKGKDFGVALHEALEALLCGERKKTPEEVVESEFLKNGVKHDDDIVKATVEMIERTLNTPINLGAGSPLKLSELESYRIQRELNFRFELENQSVKELQKIVAKHGESDLFRGVTARELSGLLKGSIDLLFEHEGKFYVVDYKGNYLGDSIGDYEEPNLTERVEQQNYDLQAFVYSLAVDRMLRARTDESIATQHGGAVYLYTRAIGLSETAGVWRRHFDPALLKEMNEMLAVKGESQ